jgi:hypothetical protein
LKVIRYIYAVQIRSGCLISGYLGFWVVRVWIGSSFRSFDLRFWIVRVRIGSDFRLSDLESSRIFGSFRFRSDRVSGCLISGHLRFQVVRVRIRSGSDQFVFLKKSGRVEFRSERIGRVSRSGLVLP